MREGLLTPAAVATLLAPNHQTHLADPLQRLREANLQTRAVRASVDARPVQREFEELQEAAGVSANPTTGRTGESEPVTATNTNHAAARRGDS